MFPVRGWVKSVKYNTNYLERFHWEESHSTLVEVLSLIYASYSWMCYRKRVGGGPAHRCLCERDLLKKEGFHSKISKEPYMAFIISFMPCEELQRQKLQFS